MLTGAEKLVGFKSCDRHNSARVSPASPWSSARTARASEQRRPTHQVGAGRAKPKTPAPGKEMADVIFNAVEPPPVEPADETTLNLRQAGGFAGDRHARGAIRAASTARRREYPDQSPAPAGCATFAICSRHPGPHRSLQGIEQGKVESFVQASPRDRRPDIRERPASAASSLQKRSKPRAA